MGADVFDGAFQVQEGAQDSLAAFVAVGGAHQADDGTVAVAQGELVGDVPVGKPLTVEEELHQIEPWLSGGQHGFVVLAKSFGERAGEELEVVLAQNLRLGVKTKALKKETACPNDAALRVLGEEGDVGEVVEDLIEGRVGAQLAEEELSFQIGALRRLRGLAGGRHGVGDGEEGGNQRPASQTMHCPESGRQFWIVIRFR